MIGSESDGADGSPMDDILAALASGRRRAVLAHLRGLTEPVEVGDLAAVVAAESGDADPRAVRTTLVHRHLPKLAAADLVEWDRDRGVVAPADHPVLAAPGVDEVLAADADDWDDVLRALSDRRRRVVLAVLATAEGAVARDALARQVAARELGVVPADPSPEAVESVAVSLRHVHLPLLAEADLVATTGDGVEYLGHPALDDGWLAYDADAAAESAAPPAADGPVEAVVELVD